MKFSAWPGSGSPWQDLVAECQHVAKTGWYGVWIADHFLPGQLGAIRPNQECWTTLAGLAALVPDVRLGSLVTCNTFRNPAVLAKQVAQVDIISGGRVVLGMGSGWQESEHTAYGIPFYDVPTRLRRLEESLQVLRNLFDNERTTWQGKHYTLRDAPLSPKPLQARLPIMVGGGGEQMTIKLAAKYGDEWNIRSSPEVFEHKMKVLQRHCENIGRDPKNIRVSAQAQVTISNDREVVEAARGSGAFAGAIVAGSLEEVRDQIGRYRDAGLHEFILPDGNLGATVAERCESYDRFREDVAGVFA